MRKVLQSFATPFTAALFLVSAISGAALFFHVNEGIFHEMHEWLSMALLIPVGLHLWRNWGPLAGYIKRGSFLLPVSVCAALALGFAGQNLFTSDGGNPGFAAVRVLMEARLSAIAPIVHARPDELAATLRRKGYTVASTEATLLQIAEASGKEPPQVVFAIMPAETSSAAP